MIRINRTLATAAATAVVAIATMTPAAAHGHGYDRHWGVGRGLVGAVVGLVTLPLVVASAVIFGAEDEERGYRGEPYRDDSYEPRPAYPPPSDYYSPRAEYYQEPRAYYAPPPRYYYREPRYYPVPGQRSGYSDPYRNHDSYRHDSYRHDYYRPDVYAYPQR